MEKVRPGTGRETGLGHAGVRAPKVGALGDAWSSCRKSAEKFFIKKQSNVLRSSRLHGEDGVLGTDQAALFTGRLENELNNWMMRIIKAIENKRSSTGLHAPDELPEQIQSVQTR
jgi:hypothetical protein